MFDKDAVNRHKSVKYNKLSCYSKQMWRVWGKSRASKPSVPDVLVLKRATIKRQFIKPKTSNKKTWKVNHLKKSIFEENNHEKMFVLLVLSHMKNLNYFYRWTDNLFFYFSLDFTLIWIVNRNVSWFFSLPFVSPLFSGVLYSEKMKELPAVSLSIIFLYSAQYGRS